MRWLAIIVLVALCLFGLFSFGKESNDCEKRGGEYAKSRSGLYHCYGEKIDD